MLKLKTRMIGRCLVALATLMPLVTLAPLMVTPAYAAPPDIVGTWKNIATPERLVIQGNGLLSSCYVGSITGNAAKGWWVQTRPGQFKVVFTHAVAASCGPAQKTLRKYQNSIVGQFTSSASELALFVSGEGPPDRFRRVAPVEMP